MHWVQRKHGQGMVEARVEREDARGLARVCEVSQYFELLTFSLPALTSSPSFGLFPLFGTFFNSHTSLEYLSRQFLPQKIVKYHIFSVFFIKLILFLLRCSYLY